MGSVREEIRQSRPFSSLADEGVVTLLRTTDSVRRALSEVVAPHGITLQQYNVLRILRGAGPDGLPTLDVAARMIETTPGITRLLDRLERKHLVRRKRCPNDHRRVLCSTSDEGLSVLAKLDGPMSEVARHILEPLGDAPIRKLIRLLDHARGTASRQVADDSRNAAPVGS
jgi:DNA-binding MarR family transcriptional regulator